MNTRLLYVLVALLVVVAACKPTSVKPVAEKKDPVEGLIFLTFVMRQDSLSGKPIELKGKTIVNQKLRREPQNSTAADRIWVSQLTNSGTKLSFIALDHPLFRRVEFANDKGQFQSKEIKLKEAEFFARVTLFTQTEYILVEEELSGKITYSVKFKLRD